MAESRTLAAVALAAFTAGGAAGRLASPGADEALAPAGAQDPLGGWHYAARPRQVCLEGNVVRDTFVQAAVRPAVVTLDGTLVSVPELRGSGAFWACYSEMIEKYRLDSFGMPLCQREGPDIPGYVEVSVNGRELERAEDFSPCVLEIFQGAVRARPLSFARAAAPTAAPTTTAPAATAPVTPRGSP